MVKHVNLVIKWIIKNKCKMKCNNNNNISHNNNSLNNNNNNNSKIKKDYVIIISRVNANLEIDAIFYIKITKIINYKI